MIGYFKERSALQIPAFLFLTIVLKIAFTSSLPQVEMAGGHGLLSAWLVSPSAKQLSASFLNGLGLFILTGSALYANITLASRKMFSQRHLLAAICFILFTSLFPGINRFSAATLLLPFTIALFDQMARLYTTQHPRSILMNIGLILGLGYLLYHPFILLLPAAFFGLASMRPFRFSEWLLILLGALTPLYFVLSYQYLTDQWHPAQHLPNFSRIGSVNSVSGWYWSTAIVTLVIWLLVAFSGWQAQSRRMVIQGRKNWYVLMVMGLCCIPGFFWPEGNAYPMLTLMSFPAGCLLANAFTAEGKGISQLLFFWLLIIVIAIVSWGWKTGAMN